MSGAAPVLPHRSICTRFCTVPCACSTLCLPCLHLRAPVDLSRLACSKPILGSGQEHQAVPVAWNRGRHAALFPGCHWRPAIHASLQLV